MEINQAISEISKKQRSLLLLIVVGLVILGGVWTAIWLDQSKPQVQQDGQAQGTIITEITFAGLRTPAEESRQNPTLKQQNNYQTGEPLALRITTADNVTDPIQISVRLLDKGGGIHELSPPSVEFKPGTSTFCCWRINEPGSYTLQIFRPEKIVTTIPVLIQGAAVTAKPFAT